MPTPVSETTRRTKRSASSSWVVTEWWSHADAIGRDAEATAAGHRVARVEGEVQQHLLELAAIGQRGRQPAAEIERELDLLAERAAKQRLESPHQLGEVERGGRRVVAAAEGKQLSGQRGPALGRLYDLVGIAAQRVVGEPGDQDLAEAVNRGQQVVEVVRDARRRAGRALRASATAVAPLRASRAPPRPGGSRSRRDSPSRTRRGGRRLGGRPWREPRPGARDRPSVRCTTSPVNEPRSKSPRTAPA